MQGADVVRHPVDDGERLGIVGVRLGGGGRGRAKNQRCGKDEDFHGPSRLKRDNRSENEAEAELPPSLVGRTLAPSPCRHKRSQPSGCHSFTSEPSQPEPRTSKLRMYSTG